MQVELTASDGHALSAYRVDPAGTPRGAVVVAMEIFGVNHHIRGVVDGFARDGYVAIAPALYDRYERDFVLDQYIPASVVRGRALKAQATVPGAMADVAAAVASVASAGQAASRGNVGIVGYCWGGFVAWMASAQVAGLACAIPYYGGGILDHTDITLRCPVQAHFGERDAGIPVDQVRALGAKYPSVDLHIYAADHGFNCDERGSYDADAAKLARERTLAFLQLHVG